MSSQLNRLRGVLQEHGLRSTMPRLAVLRELTVVKKPVSHGELADRLEPEGLDRATVYRNLLTLTEVGLVTRTDMGDHVWRFELQREGHDATSHAHFVCTDCGNVRCLPGDAVAFDKKLKLFRNATGFEVQVKGRCEQCA